MFLQLMFVLMLNTVISQIFSTNSSQTLLSTNCTHDINCTTYFSSYCKIDDYSDTVKFPVGKCVCNNSERFFLSMSNDTCIYSSRISETCDDNVAVCEDSNALCLGTGIKRCTCKEGTVLVNYKNTKMCVYPLLASGDCEECYIHFGTCFSLTNDSTRDGCACPTTSSGDNCQVSHVNVSCTTDTMTVCYYPHEELNGLQFWIHPDGYDQTFICRGKYRSIADADCAAGTYAIELSLEKALIHECGTRLIWEGNNIKYTNTIRVQMNKNYGASEDIVFTTFCSFVSTRELTFVGVKVDSYSGTEVGQDILPLLSLSMRDHMGQTIRNDVYYNVGDIVYINLYLDTDNGYSSLRVDECSLSSSARLKDPGAETVPILIQGCPAPNQYVLTEKNTFQRVNNKSNEWETGIVQLVQLRSSNTLHIHCKIKLCIKPYKAGCEPLQTCSNTTRRRRYIHHTSEVDERQKRSIERKEDIAFVDIHGSISFADTSASPNVILGMSLSAIAFSIIIVFFIIILIVIVIVRMRSKKQQEQPPTRTYNPTRKTIAYVNTGELFIKKNYINNIPSYMTESNV